MVTVALEEIVSYCSKRLNVQDMFDYPNAYNGLQFMNSGRIYKIAAAVDGSLESIRLAGEVGANLLVVHHGLFWGKSIPVVDGVYAKYKALIDNDIAIYSSHLPLDAHQEIGNNALLARDLGFGVSDFEELGFHGVKIAAIVNEPIGREELKCRLADKFTSLVSMEFGPSRVKKLAIISGGGGQAIPSLGAFGIDTFITGECRQHSYSEAYEHGLNVYVCGHYATECLGIMALASELGKAFSLPQVFVKTSCPL
ncbi:MAG: Nif3-like dinuclear metal center hexameric protein [Puniceicoccales bacterium]|jgi:dinuclear metal center YbgI/SA1388 family protein|nr:Nif3-like dinuclear metal center hexameric protein [Puniceicoccales bacterium]